MMVTWSGFGARNLPSSMKPLYYDTYTAWDSYTPYYYECVHTNLLMVTWSVVKEVILPVWSATTVSMVTPRHIA